MSTLDVPWKALVLAADLAQKPAITVSEDKDEIEEWIETYVKLPFKKVQGGGDSEKAALKNCYVGIAVEQQLSIPPNARSFFFDAKGISSPPVVLSIATHSQVLCIQLARRLGTSNLGFLPDAKDRLKAIDRGRVSLKTLNSLLKFRHAYSTTGTVDIDTKDFQGGSWPNPETFADQSARSSSSIPAKQFQFVELSETSNLRWLLKSRKLSKVTVTANLASSLFEHYGLSVLNVEEVCGQGRGISSLVSGAFGVSFKRTYKSPHWLDAHSRSDCLQLAAFMPWIALMLHLKSKELPYHQPPYFEPFLNPAHSCSANFRIVSSSASDSSSAPEEDPKPRSKTAFSSSHSFTSSSSRSSSSVSRTSSSSSSSSSRSSRKKPRNERLAQLDKSLQNLCLEMPEISKDKERPHSNTGSSVRKCKQIKLVDRDPSVQSKHLRTTRSTTQASADSADIPNNNNTCLDRHKTLDNLIDIYFKLKQLPPDSYLVQEGCRTLDDSIEKIQVLWPAWERAQQQIEAARQGGGRSARQH